MKTSVSTAWQFVQLIYEIGILQFTVLILFPFRVWNQCVPLNVLNVCVSLFFFLLCNGQDAPCGLVAPHQGASCPTYGARRLFLIIILFDD